MLATDTLERYKRGHLPKILTALKARFRTSSPRLMLAQMNREHALREVCASLVRHQHIFDL